MSRFDYVKYDEKSNARQTTLKNTVSVLEAEINCLVHCPRSKALALTKLEEVYMWIGKGIRNDQIERNKVEMVQTELQEERNFT
jgi:hypothetical protein